MQHNQKVHVPWQWLTPALFASLSSARLFLAPPCRRGLPATNASVHCVHSMQAATEQANYLKNLSVRTFSHNSFDCNQVGWEALALVCQRCVHSQACPSALDILTGQAWPALTQKARVHVATTRLLQASCTLQHCPDATTPLLRSHV